jgi:hypothetical protein
MASLPLGDEPYQPSEEFLKRREASRAALKLEMERIKQEWARPRTPEELARMDAFIRRMDERKPLTPGPHPTAEEMIREDRER